VNVRAAIASDLEAGLAQSVDELLAGSESLDLYDTLFRAEVGSRSSH